jgi:hypothetical protein
MWIAQTIGIKGFVGLSLDQSEYQQVYDAAEKQSRMLSGLRIVTLNPQPSGWQQAKKRSNSLYRDAPSGKGAPDEEKIFICRGEPFAYHPKWGDIQTCIITCWA